MVNGPNTVETKWELLYHIYWSLSRQLCWENVLLLISKILRLVVKGLTADEKYFLPNRDNLMQPIHMQKRKTFSRFFFCIFQINIKFETSSKKWWPSRPMYFPNYGLQKRWLDNCLKKSILENPLRSNMVNGRKHCWKLNDSAFAIFLNNCESNSVRKSLS